MPNEYEKKVNKVTAATLVCNGALAVGKLLAGIFAHSTALISDAAQSVTDCVSSVVVMVGVHISAKKSDKDHPYGHERMECISALVLAAIFLATALVIGVVAVTEIVGFFTEGKSDANPSWLAFGTVVGAILVKGGLYFYTENKAKRLKSSALHGMAVDHLSDSLSSIGALVGIVGTMCGVAVLDSFASLFIAGMIVRAALGVCFMAIDQLVDKSASEEVEQEITKVILETEGVERIDVLRTRQYGNKIFVDVEIAVATQLSLIEAHKIAESVHERVEHGEIEDIKHCMVHVNPLGGEDNHEAFDSEME